MVKDDSTNLKLVEDKSKSLHLGVPGAILSCGLSHDAKVAASCSSNQKILIWDLTNQKCMGSLDGHKNDVTSCSFGKELLASGSRDGVLYLWKYKDLKRASAIKVHSGAVNACAISRDARFLASASDDRTIRVFTIRGGDGEFIQGPANKELLGHTDVVTDVDFSGDSCALVSASADGNIKLWDSESGENLVTIDTGKGKILKANFSADSNYIVSLTRKNLSVWNIAKRKIAWEVEDANGFQDISCHPTENIVFAVLMDGSVATYNINTKAELQKGASDHRGPILSCSFAANGEIAVTGGLDGKVVLWNVKPIS